MQTPETKIKPRSRYDPAGAPTSVPSRVRDKAKTAPLRPWGAAAMGQALMLQRTGHGPMFATVYARLYVQKASAVSATYTAQFPVTLRYGAVIGNFADCNALGSVAAGPAAPNQLPFLASLVSAKALS